MDWIRTMTTVAALAAASTAAGEGPARVTFSKPAEERRDCVGEEMRLPAELQGSLPREVEVWFTVRADGSVRDVRTGKVRPALATQLRGALSRCRFTPAADARGVPIAVEVVMPIRFALQPPSDTTPFSPEVATATSRPLRVVALATR